MKAVPAKTASGEHSREAAQVAVAETTHVPGTDVGSDASLQGRVPSSVSLHMASNRASERNRVGPRSPSLSPIGEGRPGGDGMATMPVADTQPATAPTRTTERTTDTGQGLEEYLASSDVVTAVNDEPGSGEDSDSGSGTDSDSDSSDSDDSASSAGGPKTLPSPKRRPRDRVVGSPRAARTSLRSSGAVSDGDEEAMQRHTSSGRVKDPSLASLRALHRALSSPSLGGSARVLLPEGAAGTTSKAAPAAQAQKKGKLRGVFRTALRFGKSALRKAGLRKKSTNQMAGVAVGSSQAKPALPPRFCCVECRCRLFQPAGMLRSKKCKWCKHTVEAHADSIQHNLPPMSPEVGSRVVQLVKAIEDQSQDGLVVYEPQPGEYENSSSDSDDEGGSSRRRQLLKKRDSDAGRFNGHRGIGAMEKPPQWVLDHQTRLPSESPVARIAGYVQTGEWWTGRPEGMVLDSDDDDTPDFSEFTAPQLGAGLLLVLSNNAPLFSYPLFTDFESAALKGGTRHCHGAMVWYGACLLAYMRLCGQI